jgi:hypothetical protein
MTCNRRMFEQIVVGYDTYMQTEEFEYNDRSWPATTDG